jgi:hypothetical protein
MANAKRCIPRDKARRAAEATLPPIVGREWVGEDPVSQEGWAKLGDGFAASVVAGEGAIDPYAQPPGGHLRLFWREKKYQLLFLVETSHA